MVEHTPDRHPDLDVLADLAAGVLGRDDAKHVTRHLDDCHRCRLELKRLQRFLTIDQDQDLIAEADWQAARFALEQAYQETVKPSLRAPALEEPVPHEPAAHEPAPHEPAAHEPVAREPAPRDPAARKPVAREPAPRDPAGPRRTRSVRSQSHLRWLVPVAAAAVLAAVMIGIGTDRPGVRPFEDASPGHPVRGDGPVQSVIELDEPVGEVAAAPRIFAWRVATEFETYALEVVTPDLKRVFVQAGLEETRFTVPDSLRTLLKPGASYLWSVEGRAGLATTAVSETGWFQIEP